MTREHKLALIVGFSLVLVVGVLISDHFSKARNTTVATDLSEGSPDRFGGGTTGLTHPSSPDVALAPSASPMRPNPIPLPEAGPRQEPPPPSSTEIVMGMPRGSAQPSGETVPEALRPYFEPVAGPVRTTGPGFDPTVGRQTPTPGQSTIPPPPALPEQSPVVVTPPIPGKPVSAGKVVQHRVRDGDSIYRIAANTYGDGNLWQKLLTHNKGKINSDGGLREGVTLTLPPKDVLLGEAEMPGSRPAQPASPASTPAPPAQTASANVYTVQRGDILGEVSRKLLGTTRRWTEIASLNNLDDPDNLSEGMKLKIPAR